MPEQDITQFFGTNFHTDHQKVISYIYKTQAHIDRQILQLAGVVDLKPFLSQAIVSYCKARESEIKSTFVALAHTQRKTTQTLDRSDYCNRPKSC